MMSDDLEWTQALGDAIAWQQKDLLIAIQQLRDEAVAKGVIKTDDKVIVENKAGLRSAVMRRASTLQLLVRNRVRSRSAAALWPPPKVLPIRLYERQKIRAISCFRPIRSPICRSLLAREPPTFRGERTGREHR